MKQYYYDEEVFTTVNDFSRSFLSDIMKICGWKQATIAQILGISPSSVNNLLGNSSKTNANPTAMSRPQFITILSDMQRIVAGQKLVSIAFAAFSYLCPGICEIDCDKHRHIVESECYGISGDQLVKDYATLFPQNVRNINYFTDWQKNAPDLSLCQYLGIKDVLDPKLQQKTPPTEKDITACTENARQFIPRFLNIYMSEVPVFLPSRS